MLVTSSLSFSHNVFYNSRNEFKFFWSHSFLARLFSERIRGIAICRCRRRPHAKTLTFCNISVITEDIYLKLGICKYSKSNPYYQGRQFNFFSELCPFFHLNILCSIKHLTAILFFHLLMLSFWPCLDMLCTVIKRPEDIVMKRNVRV